MDILLTVLSRDETGEETSDPRRTLRLSGVSRLVASYRAGHWDDPEAEVLPLDVDGLRELLRRNGGTPIYGWEFVDNDGRSWPDWRRRLSLDLALAGTGGHHLTLFQDLQGKAHLDFRAWFSDLSVLDGAGGRLDLDAFIAGRSALVGRDVRRSPLRPRARHRQRGPGGVEAALVGPIPSYFGVGTSVERVTDESEAQGRSVLVTGGNRGIGRAIAEAFVAQGDKVAVTTRSGGAPDGTLDVRCDVTDPEQVEAAFAQVEEAHGPVEVLVANAGITHDTLLLRMSEEDWSSVIETNLTGSYRLAKRAAKGMLRLRRGRIVFVSSVVGLLGSAGQVNYAASKAGLVGMARSIARELGSRSITANVVAPGFVETDMTGVLTDEQKAAIKAQVPLQRYATTDEVAAAVTWLAGDGAAYVTGAVIPVDGGLGMGH